MPRGTVKSKMNRQITVIVCGTALLTAAAVIFALRSRRRPLPPPDVPTALSSTEVRVKALERKAEPLELGTLAVASDVVAIVCGVDDATAGRYETRNDALRSIMRSRSLTKDDATALMAYLASTNDAMRVERVAALKNDVMNLLRSQEPPPANLAEALIAMFDGGGYPPAVLDYCVQHLGAMQGGIVDGALRARVHDVLVKAARRKNMPYAGTALYSLAADRCATSAAAGRAETPHARPVRRRLQSRRPHRGDTARGRARLRRGAACSAQGAFLSPPRRRS